MQKRFFITDNIRLSIKYQIHAWRYPGVNPKLKHSELDAWSVPDLVQQMHLENGYAPLGVEGGIARSLEHMQALADLLKARGIPLTIAVYPYGVQIADGRSTSRQIDIYRSFCERNCARFINLFPAFLSAARADADWRSRYFLTNDFHYSADGNRLAFDELVKQLLPQSAVTALPR
jgi:hypothetical protein